MIRLAVKLKLIILLFSGLISAFAYAVEKDPSSIDSVTNKSNEKVQSVFLPYDQNNFAFHFKSSDDWYQNYVSYRYKLIGLDNKWRVTTKIDSIVPYANLKAGEYLFVLEGSRNNNEYLSIRKINVVVDSNPFLSWPALAIYGFIFLVLIAGWGIALHLAVQYFITKNNLTSNNKNNYQFNLNNMFSSLQHDSKKWSGISNLYNAIHTVKILFTNSFNANTQVENRIQAKKKVRSNNSAEKLTSRSMDCCMRSKDIRFKDKLDVYIEEHLADKITVESMATALAMNRSAFTRKVKNITSLSAQQYLLHYRLKKAYEYLPTASSVGEVSDMTGFSTQSHLSSAFTKKFGMHCRERMAGKSSDRMLHAA